MKKSRLFLLLNFLCFFCAAQKNECFLTKDTFYIVSLDIRQKDRYPIIMSGVTRTSKLQNLNNKNIDSLLSDFYQFMFYCPSLSSSIDRRVIQCLGDSIGNLYLRNHAIELTSRAGIVRSQSRIRSFILESGEIVDVYLSVIGGTFWKTDKTASNIGVSSDEISIQQINTIQQCYIPFEINYYQKPSKKLLRRLLPSPRWDGLFYYKE